MAEKIKTPEEEAETQVNKQLGKSIAKRKLEIKKKQAEIKKLQKEIVKIKDGELIDDEDSSSSSKKGKGTKVAFLLDESGSMSSCKDSTIEGYNDYIKKLQKSKSKFKMTFTKFDSDNINTMYKNKDIMEVPLLNDENYQPGAMTPLLDAIGRTMDILKGFKDVLFIIQTDGHENASHEYTTTSIKKKIENFSDKKGWEFVYLGADQDAFLNAKDYGFSRGQTYSYNTVDSHGTFAMGLSDFSLNFDRGMVSGCNFGSSMTKSMKGKKKKEVK